MNRFRKMLGVLLIVVGPVTIFLVATWAFRKVAMSDGLWEALPWLLVATAIIPAGMSIAVVGFLCVKGEYD